MLQVSSGSMGVRGIIFSLENDEVWASWPSGPSINLGSRFEVSAMMRDFLDQEDVAARLMSCRDRRLSF